MTTRPYEHLDSGSVGFVDRNVRWGEAQQAAAERVLEQVDGLSSVRVAFSDPHGLARAKTVSADTFRTVLRNGIDCSAGPFVFDTGHAVAVDFFAPGGGIGVPELTGAGDFLVVPDPETFRVLPHTGGRVGWVIGDEHLRSGEPHPLSARHALRSLLAEAAGRRQEVVIGLEVEWYLTRRLDPDGFDGTVGGFGVQGEPPSVRPVNGGYQFNLDGVLDALAPVLDPLGDHLRELGLPLRTIEHESGPGQLEFTFGPLDALAAADAMLLLRTVIKQVCARLGHHASFMALPGIPGFDPSGWHLHQSVFDLDTGQNLFAAAGTGPDPLSPFGMSYLGGLLEHAAETMLLSVPTVNGYRRTDKRFSLSPERLNWSTENRGVFLRVLGVPGPTSHVENRVGEPNANPYLAIAGQVASGMDGVGQGRRPGPPAGHPDDDASALPADLGAALTGFRAGELCRKVFGDALVGCLDRLKQSELDRYSAWLESPGAGPESLEWEHREYFAHY